MNDLNKEIAALEKVEYLTETNDGTFGPTEAVRAVGAADPVFSVRRVYETVGGSRRETGPSADDAPGRIRRLNAAALAADRRRLADLRKQLAAAR